MTRMLVRVADAREAAQAALADVDVIELDGDAVAGVDLPAIRQAFPRTLRLRVGAAPVSDVIEQATKGLADEIAWAPGMEANGLERADWPKSLRAIAIIAPGPDQITAVARLRDRAGGLMLDAGHQARLVDQAGISELDAFASACTEATLPFGLAGGLEAPDVARLLLLRPDVLCFDHAVRIDHRADGALDPKALDAIRALIPREGAIAAEASRHETATDRIFVRNFVSLLSIGVYQAEHAIRQRVRFSVEADVLRAPVSPRDMRDVFSYDVIIETIRVLSQRAHVTFVETLAEDIAASLLTHPELTMVIVTVEKLDVIDGAVGIEIVRRAAK